MTSNCTDTSNAVYRIFWFDYFVSIQYITNSDVVNLYAPYGKCTQSFLWITYLINIVHFFFLSTGVLNIVIYHRKKSGLLWPFLNWSFAAACIVASIVLFIFFQLQNTLFTIVILSLQLVALTILWFSIYTVVIVKFRSRKRACVIITVLLILQICLIMLQALITMHCLYNLKFPSLAFDYTYWSAIVAAVAAVVSTLLLNCMLMLSGGERQESSPVTLVRTVQSNQDRGTSPADPVVLQEFYRRREPSLFHVYNNTDNTRRFRIFPTNHHSTTRQRNLLSPPDTNNINPTTSSPSEIPKPNVATVEDNTR